MMILITRPTPQGELLKQLLDARQIHALHTPMIEFSDGRDTQTWYTQLQCLPKNSIVIALSQHVFRGITTPLTVATDNTYLAIGQTTAQKMQQCFQLPVHYPSPNETSEALLARPELTDVSGKTILILRGNRGRTILVNTLIKRGANVVVCECYQRHFIDHDASSILTTWQNQGVNTIVVTSQEILQRLNDLTPTQQKKWLFSRQVIVVSPRLATYARQLGWQQVIIAQSAQHQAVIEAIESLDMKE